MLDFNPKSTTDMQFMMKKNKLTASVSQFL